MAEVPGLVPARSLINKASRSMGELNTAIRAVQNDRSLSEKQKKTKLQPLIKTRNELARRVTEVIGQIEEQQGATFRSAA
jgi:DNA anti-recombination protein RmuC